MSTVPVVTLVIGDEPTVLSDAVHTVVHEALGGVDRDLALAQLTEDDYRVDDRYELAPLVDAAQTPPFLTEHRVVVGRHLGRFTKADDLAPLLEYLADPLPTTRLVLVWERGQNPRQDRHGSVPKKLTDAVGASGGTIVDTAIGTGKVADAWLEERLTHAAVKLDRDARTLVHQRFGEDRSRVVGLLATLEAAYGAGAKAGVDEIEPFLGEAGSVPPWELTDAIDRGDIPAALDKLTRMLGAGDRHQLQVLATLHSHYGRMLRLDGEAGLDERAAAKVLGLKGSTFPAKKALTQSKRLGSRKLRNAFALLADADLALRGARAWPPELVMEVLVARLANLSRR